MILVFVQRRTRGGCGREGRIEKRDIKKKKKPPGQQGREHARQDPEGGGEAGLNF